MSLTLPWAFFALFFSQGSYDYIITYDHIEIQENLVMYLRSYN